MNRSCKKVKHKSKEAADAVVRRLLIREKQKPNKMRSGYLLAYKCKNCDAWHVGHVHHKQSLTIFIDKVMAADAARKKEYQHADAE